MKRPDRLEAPHLRHEHIDDHPIEDRFADGNKAGRAAIGHREAAAIEPRLYRKADVQIIVNGQNSMHTGPQPCATRWTKRLR